MPFVRALFIFCLLIPLHIFAQEVEGYRHYTVEDGLLSNSIQSTFQDSHGYIWICTDRGVSRFNGYEFENFTTRDGLIDNYNYFCREDEQGRIWFVGLSPELCYYQEGKIHPYQFNDRISDLKVIKHYRMSMVMNGDEIYIGNFMDGYYHIDADGKAEKVTPPNGMYYEQKEGGALIYEVINKEELINQLYINQQSYPFEYPSHRGSAEIYHIDSTIFIRKLNQLYALQNDSIVLVRTEQHPIESVQKDVHGKLMLMFGSQEFGFKVFENIWDQAESPITQFKHIYVRNVMQDFEKGFWYSTMKGLYYKPYNPHIVKSDPTNLLPKTPLTFLRIVSNDLSYLKTQNGDVFKVEGPDLIATFLYNNGINSLYAPAIYYDTRAQKLLNKEDLLNQFETEYLKKHKELPRKGYAQWVYGNYKDTYWKVFEHGIYQFKDGKLVDIIDHNTKIISEHAHPISQFYSRILFVENDSLRFIATAASGLFEYKGGQLIFMGDKHAVLNNPINDIQRLGHDTLIVSIAGRGTFIWTTDSLISLNEKYGLVYDEVYEMRVDKNGNAWLSTNNGLVRFKIVNSEIVNYTRIDKIHGLPSNHVIGMELMDSVLWLSTTKGVCIINTNKIMLNKSPPLVEITRIKINEQDTLKHNHYDLNYTQNYIEIDYTGIAFKNAGKLDYQYQLEGLEETWQSTKSRFIRYHKINSGEYVFKLRASNEDGIWSAPISFSFTVNPPFWFNPWFIALEILCLALLIFFIISWRENRQKEKAAHLRQEVEFRRKNVELELKALRSQMNPHFTFNTLNAIQQYILNHNSIEANDYLSNFAALIRKVLENSRHSTISLENEIHTLQMYLDMEVLRFPDKLTYFIDIDDQLEIDSIYIPPTLIQPFVENSIVHGIMNKEEGGKILISIKRENGKIKCIIEDDGVGREKAKKIRNSGFEKEDSLGMKISWERINLLKAYGDIGYDVNILDLKDDENKPIGTRVELLVSFSTNVNNPLILADD